MGWLGWALVFALIAVVSIALLALLGLRLWRTVKALGRDVQRASDVLGDLSSRQDRSAPR
jgi:predicted MFS family arabinose efflux permease